MVPDHGSARLCYPLAVQPWVNCLTSLLLSLPICKMGILKKGKEKKMHVNYLAYSI